MMSAIANSWPGGGYLLWEGSEQVAERIPSASAVFGDKKR